MPEHILTEIPEVHGPSFLNAVTTFYPKLAEHFNRAEAVSSEDIKNISRLTKHNREYFKFISKILLKQFQAILNLNDPEIDKEDRENTLAFYFSEFCNKRSDKRPNHELTEKLNSIKAVKISWDGNEISNKSFKDAKDLLMTIIDCEILYSRPENIAVQRQAETSLKGLFCVLVFALMKDGSSNSNEMDTCLRLKI